MSNCSEYNILDYFTNKLSKDVKSNVLNHVNSCKECRTLFNEYKTIFNELGNLEIDTPNVADEDYFLSLGVKIDKKIKNICSEVQDSLVDYCEGMLDDAKFIEKKTLIDNHLDLCRSCTQEYFLTKKVLDINSKETKINDDYFSTLADKITEKVFSKIDSICEKARDHIPSLFTKDEIPKNYKNHLETCFDCKEELNRTKELYSALNNLEVSIPDESYFETLAYKIENTVNLMPSHGKVKEKNQSFISRLVNFILRPQIAVTTTAVVSLLVFATLTFMDHKDATTPYNFSKTSTQSLELDKGTKVIKDLETNIDTASSGKNLFFDDKKLSDPKKDATLDANKEETAKK